MYHDLTASLAIEHQRDLRREGCFGRLAALAACCTPGRLHRAGTAIAHRIRPAEKLACTL